MRLNVDVGIQYLESWLRGNGCVPIYNLMEDAATAEISRAQVWQWLRHGARLSDGRSVTRELVTQTIAEELAEEKERFGAARFDSGKFAAGFQIVRADDDRRRVPGFYDLGGVRSIGIRTSQFCADPQPRERPLAGELFVSQRIQRIYTCGSSRRNPACY